MKKLVASTVLALSVIGASAVPAAADNIKIGYVDPLSGGAASIGQIGLNQLNFIADTANKNGGINGEQVEVIGYDNQINPQTSLVQVQKAIDEGVRIIIQGNGSSVGSAIEGFVAKYNRRNPDAHIVYLNYGAIDPVMTNDNCSYWHFGFDANTNVKMAALTNFIKQRAEIKKVYLIDQDYSFGHAVADAAVSMLKEKRPDIEIVGNEFHPLVKITDFSPYIAKIKASGADTVITSNWGQDFSLLIKAAGQSGLDVNWYTYYAGAAGGPTAIKQADMSGRVFQINEGISNLGYEPAEKTAREYGARYKDAPVLFPRIFNTTAMLFKAIEAAGSQDPADFIPKLEGMKYASFSAGGDSFMRKDDHQLFQPLYISSFGPLANDKAFDEEHTGWGWNKVGEIAAKDTVVPTTCEMKRPG
ncbi:branched-chain amino acid ABC transporter substrate-binding protein [Thalassospira mesophila]|uniref:Branched-chain amino acid ABC transporter substrate-binding protein n=1 Tax=Thalassospira mesophila TaxID=1293891 RepID=A0A1Y2L029_9PROT|nr:branched-chain amino acid ABC transporter substrate-binding protein [Thalassospira mesophila]OSQ38468.1 branched-chain amino acid ABC transporter substrate-binding protein [Thalassospira mesophila]